MSRDFALVHASTSWLILCERGGCCAGFESYADTQEAARMEAYQDGWRVDRYGQWHCEQSALERDGETDGEEWVPLHLIKEQT